MIPSSYISTRTPTIVVTGIGLVTPIGNSVAESWTNLMSSRSGIVNLPNHPDMQSSTRQAIDKLPCKIAGWISRPSFSQNEPIPSDSQIRKSSMFIQYAVRAAHEALDDAEWTPTTSEQRYATGVSIGSGIGSVDDFATLGHLPWRKISPYAVPNALVNMAAGWVSSHFGLWGPNQCCASACAAGSHSIIDAARSIIMGDAQVMVAGASESTVNPISLAGFARAKALCTDSNDSPGQSCRPFDKSRSGFVMGEGSGILVLESLDHALARGAPRIYAILAGSGSSSDGNHPTTPLVDGRGAIHAMRMALRNTDPSRIGYINAHATGTLLGDVAEGRAIQSVFQKQRGTLPLISSTKAATGHLLGAAGAVEAAFSILSLVHNVVPPTLNLHNLQEEFDGLDIVANEPRRNVNLDAVMSNSFGFGGTNASLVFTRYPQ